MDNKEQEYFINQKPSFWEKKLTEKEYQALVEAGTDSAFDNKYYHHQKKGIYVCAACRNVLFSSADKYDSGSGWPSFSDLIFSDSIGTRADNKLAQERTEVFCARCGGHLGHIFSDGPQPTGLRYCINYSSLTFLKQGYLAQGCFWGPDASYGALDGVYFTASGYAGGDKKDPSYHNLGNHTETVRISYDPEQISWSDLLDIYWESHNPNSRAASKQYSSIIFVNDSHQEKTVQKFLDKKKEITAKEVYTTTQKLDKFHEAEDYHQNYVFSQDLNLKQFRKSLLNAGERLTYSRLLTKLNAYSQGELEKKKMIEELEDSYLKVKKPELIAEIKNKL